MNTAKILTIFICTAFLFGCGYTEEEVKIIDANLRWSVFCKERKGKMVGLHYAKTVSYYCNDGSHTHFGDN